MMMKHDDSPMPHWPMPVLLERGMPADFETLRQVRERDRVRAAKLSLSKRPGAHDLARRLVPDMKRGFGDRTLASACYMRFVRMHFHHVVTQVFEPYVDADIRMVTLVPQWQAPVGKLASFPLKQALDGFAMQLRRAGVLEIPGPLIAAVHGEYDATRKAYYLHVHVLTVAAKAMLIRGKLIKHPAFPITDYVDDPVHVKTVDQRGRDGLITYLTKPYIPMRNSYRRSPDSKWSRARDQPLKSDQLAETLLWLDGLRLGNLLYESGANLPRDLRGL